MDLALSADEEQIIDSASQFLAGTLPLQRLHGAGAITTPAVRAQLAEMGWYAIALPEEFGGLGMTAIEEALVFREIGRVAGPAAVLPMAMGLHVAAAAGQTDLAEAIAAGQRGAGLIVPKPGATNGKGRVRLYEGGETDLAVLVEPDRARLYAFPDGSVTEVACLDKSIAMAEADWADATLVAEIEGDAVARRAGLALAAMQGGTAEAALAMIVEYAKIRSTFGRPIGAYQAVRHPCSDMAVRVEAAKAQLLYASVAVRDGFADAVLMIDAARAVATEAAIRNVDDNIQLHGGIGITEEHDAHLLMKRATVVAQWLGSDRMVLDRIAAASVPGTLAA